MQPQHYGKQSHTAFSLSDAHNTNSFVHLQASSTTLSPRPLSPFSLSLSESHALLLSLTCRDRRATKQPLVNGDGSSLNNLDSGVSPDWESSGKMGPFTLEDETTAADEPAEL